MTTHLRKNPIAVATPLQADDEASALARQPA
jgi:hypothetical protein